MSVEERVMLLLLLLMMMMMISTHLPEPKAVLNLVERAHDLTLVVKVCKV